MKEKILKLRTEGKTYDQIRDILGCSKGTINYHCTEKGKEKTRRRRKLNARLNMNKLKESAGGCCKFCGYNRCFDALEFHHVDPKTKNRTYNSIAGILRACSIEKAKEEVAKCILICAICHRELHANLRDCNGNLKIGS